MKGDSTLLRQVEEGVYCYTAAVGVQTSSELLIGFSLIVGGVKTREAVEIASAALSESVGEGESHIKPIAVSGSNINRS